MSIEKQFLPIVEENRKAGEWFTMISPLCSRMIFRVGALNTGWLITDNYLSFFFKYSYKNVHIEKMFILKMYRKLLNMFTEEISLFFEYLLSVQCKKVLSGNIFKW